MALVLIIDDSPTELHVMKTALERHGFETATAETGTHGMEMAREIGPDVILMDIVMPDINGYQATRQLVRDPRTASIPVVMVTTKGQESDRVWGMRQGAADYLVKPVTEDDLVQRVRAAMDR